VQWAKGQRERGNSTPIIILSESPKEELDELVAEIRAETGLDIMAREGRPCAARDLRMVSASEAQNIIIMDPHYGSLENVSSCPHRPVAGLLDHMGAWSQ
jgi:hypothetical protein